MLMLLRQESYLNLKGARLVIATYLVMREAYPAALLSHVVRVFYFEPYTEVKK